MTLWRLSIALLFYCFGGFLLYADDATFNAGTGANGVVRALAVQSDDAVLIGGEFTIFNGQPCAGIVRTLPDGELDAGFTVSTQLLSSVSCIAVQEDGRILLGTTNAGPGGAFVVRVNSDGSTDESFVTTVNGSVHAIALGTNGSIWLGGNFSEVNGLPRNRIARLDASGGVDLGFDPGAGPDGPVFALSPDADGRLLLGGGFALVGTNSVGRLVQLAHDGSLDTDFYNTSIPSAPGFSVRCIARHSDGRLLVGGRFTRSNPMSISRSIEGVAQLLADGRIDMDFASGIAVAAFGTPGVVHIVMVETGGRIIVGGNFQLFSGRSSPNLIRLSPDGTPDTCFVTSSNAAPNDAVFALARQTKDRVLAGGSFTAVGVEVRGGIARFVGGDPQPSSPKVTIVPVSGWPRAPMSGTTVLDAAVENCNGRLGYQWYRNGLPLVSNQYPYIAGRSSQLFLAHWQGPFPGDYFVTVSNSVGVTTSDVLHVDFGTVNSRFSSTNGPFSWMESPVVSAVLSVLPTESGGVLAGGRFTQVEGTNWAHLALFHADGSLDRTFTARPNRPVYSMLRQPDGRVLISGEFNAVNGQFRDRVARLEADGTLDTNYQTRLGLNGIVYSMALQPDGKIIVAGVFSIPLPGGGYMHHLARLGTNGAVDFSFNAGTNLYALNTALHFARSVLLLDDGRILVGGSFHRAIGSARDFLARFLPDGTLDLTYGTVPLLGPGGPVTTLARAPGGPIYVGGSFTNFNGAGTTNLARLLPDGTWDETFHLQFTASSTPVQALAVDSGGNIFAVTGNLSVNMSSSSILKFDSNGRRLTNYIGPALVDDFPRTGIHCLSLLPDGGMFIGGNFDSIDRQQCRRLALLLGPLAWPPEIIAASPTQTVEGGQRFLLAATVSGNATPTQVQWFQNGAAVPGETNVFLIRFESDPSMNGEYWLVASNQFGVSTGAVATVTVRPAGRPGSVVRSFIATPGPDSGVIALAGTVDGKAFVGGGFTNYHGVTRTGTARIETDGSVDLSFTRQGTAGSSSFTSALLPMADGSVIVGGGSPSVRRYKSDGKVDTSWKYDTQLSPLRPEYGFNGSRYLVSDLGMDAQGRIYVGGGFAGVRISNAPTVPIRYCLRLFENGSADTNYKVRLPYPNYLSAVLTMGMDANGDVLLGADPLDGQFGMFHLNAQGLDDGTLRDGPWQWSSSWPIDVWSILTEPGGRVLFSCDPWLTGTNFPYGLGRQLSNGSFDPLFAAEPLPSRHQYDRVLAVQRDGKILVTVLNYDSAFPSPSLPWRTTIDQFRFGERISTNRLVRLNSDGSLDTSFDIGDGPNGYISSALVRPDGKILVGGSFSRFSGHYCNNIALLHGGSPQPPSVSQPVESKTMVAGDVLHLSAHVEGFPPPQLQWLKNGIAIHGANQPAFRLRSVGWDDAGIYSLVASNASGISTSVVATVSVQAGRLNADWVDSGFSADSEPDGEVHFIVPQPDGRILIGGQFTRMGGVPRPGIARLLPDGRLDESFVPLPDFSAPSVNGMITVSKIVLMPDGKVAVSRTFTTFNYTVQNDMVRLHEDGRLDASFTNLTYKIPLLAMPDGRLLVGRGVPSLLMLARDGTVDDSFIAATNLSVFITQASLLTDGRILVSPEGGGTIERLMPDGSRDASFDRGAASLSSGSSSDICFPSPGGAIPSSYILTHAVQPDGKVLVGGVFSKYLNRYTANLLRLLPSGRIDPGFSGWGQTDYAVRAIAVQPDGKILIGGCFTNVGVYPLMAGRLHLARLHPDGSVDASFNPGPTLRGTSSGYVRAMALQPDGRVLIGGLFDSVNGTTRRNFARLNGDLVMFQTVSAGADFATKVATVAGRTYFLETRETLDTGSWDVVDSESGNGGTVTLSWQGHGGEARYYRVRVE